MTAWQTLREAPRRLSDAAEQVRPLLRIVPSGRPRSNVPFALLMVLLLGAGTVGQLLLITTLQDQAFEMRAAKTRAAELGYAVSDLEAQVYRAQAPAALAERATSLGMVPNPYGVFVDLATGEIVGEAKPVRGDELPGLLQRPQASVVPQEAPPVEGEGAPADGEGAEATDDVEGETEPPVQDQAAGVVP